MHTVSCDSGSHDIRDIGLLQSAVARPATTFNKNGLYPDVFSKPTSIMHSIIKNHPFVDDNKRTAVSAASIFLIRNNYAITASNKELERFIIKDASKNVQLQEIAKCFKKRSKI